MLTSIVGAYQDEFLQELNHRVPLLIDAERVGGEWHSFSPVLVLDGLRLSSPRSPSQSIDLSGGRIGLDVAGSLWTWSPQFTQLRLDGLALGAELTAQGQLLIRGFEGGDSRLGNWLENFLLNIEHISLENSHLDLTLPSGEQRRFDLDLQLSREGSYRRMEAKFRSSRGMQITALAEGVGNPFKPELFTGDLYLDIESADLGAMTDLLAGGGPDAWVEGSAGLEWWSSWDKGAHVAEMRFIGDDLVVAAADQSWQVPLDHMAFAARLLERRNHWALFISDLALARNEVELEIPRLQVDSWGETLRVRTAQLPLGPLSTMLAGVDAVPALAELMRILQPRGELSSLQLGITDISDPIDDWALLANFAQLSVDSWKGAPGVDSASGYLEIAPGRGFVVLDSQQFAMHFPTVYQHPLHYEDFSGTINIDWDDEALVLSSGLVTAKGEEGMANVLFGLNVPLVPSAVGIEMDLLVGLEDSHPTHRVKYVPDRLNEGLRGWLSASIGEGVINQGAFVWRGSLLPGAAPLRTVQLAFNIQETQLSYHSDWPALTDLDGVLYIDDSNVSVWSESARLFDSQISQLSVEVWSDDAAQIMLAVDGRLQGPAADGLTVINGSPLGKIVGAAFADWQLSGELATRLQLELNLTDNTVAPQVRVNTSWQDVDLDIRPGDLPVRGINGELDYHSEHGFSSRKLTGKLWQRPLTINVGQQAVDEVLDGAPYEALHETPHETPHENPVQSAVVVDIATTVDMRDVRRWLDLEPLAFAQGNSPAELQVLVRPGETPQLTIHTALAGIELDLPSPWGKSSAEDDRQFHLALPLGGDSMLLDLDLEGGLKLRLDILDGTLRAGAVGLNATPLALEAGTLLIGGHTSLVDVDEWTRFVNDYFIPQPDVQASGEEPAMPLAIVIDQLQTDSLVVGGIDLGSVLFDLAVRDGHWHVAGETSWLGGEFQSSAEGSGWQVDISHLDLSGLGDLQLSAVDERGPLELPDLTVAINGLRHGQRFLGELAFKLSSEGEVLHAQDISGQVAGMQLQPQAPGELLWYQGANARTQLRAGLHFKDLGQSLAQFGYQRILETERGKFDLAINWPGGPQDFSLAGAQGSLKVDIGEGRFLDAPSGASGTLRVVSILNLAEIVRRLSLSHMFESGIPFDQVDGEVFLHAGVIEVAAMDVQGGSSSFAFSGLSDVAAQTLDGELAVILPLANNLPWVAALTAGLPVAAGVFLLSKVFEKQVNRITSAVYRVRGTWDEPEVKFDRIFDDSSAAVRAVAAEGEPQVTTEAGAPADQPDQSDQADQSGQLDQP